MESSNSNENQRKRKAKSMMLKGSGECFDLPDDLPPDVETKYIELCKCQKSILHSKVANKFAHTSFLRSIIVHVIEISDGIKLSNLPTASIDVFETWKEILTSFEVFGMEVKFLVDKINVLIEVTTSYQAVLDEHISILKELNRLHELNKKATNDLKFVEDKNNGLKALKATEESMKKFEDRFSGTITEKAILSSKFSEIVKEWGKDLKIIQKESTLDLEIFVETLSGTTSFKVESSDTIYKLMAKIEDREGLPQKQQRLIFDGRRLQEECTFADYNIQNGSTITAVLCMCGC